MLGVTGGASKEALPLGGKTVLDLVLDEGFAAGVDRAIVVISPEKKDIEALLACRAEPIELRYQHRANGLADAIVCAREPDVDALILLPDTVFDSAAASVALAAMTPDADAGIHAQFVGDSEVGHYGILEVESGRVRRILEKPDPADTASRLAVSARYRLRRRMSRFLHGVGSGESDLTGALNLAIRRGLRVDALQTNARRYDCGSPEGYAAAVEAFGR